MSNNFESIQNKILGGMEKDREEVTEEFKNEINNIPSEKLERQKVTPTGFCTTPGSLRPRGCAFTLQNACYGFFYLIVLKSLHG